MDAPAPLPQLEAEIAALRQQLAAFRFDLAGKDWLTVEEAAYYCGVSISQFNTKAAGYSLTPETSWARSCTRRLPYIGPSMKPASGVKCH